MKNRILIYCNKHIQYISYFTTEINVITTNQNILTNMTNLDIKKLNKKNLKLALLYAMLKVNSPYQFNISTFWSKWDDTNTTIGFGNWTSTITKSPIYWISI